MIKRIMLFLILPSLLFGQISNWKGKTVNQLSGIVSGTTDIGKKSYWETKAYNQIHDIINRVDKIQYASDYTSITTAFSGLSDSSGGQLFIPKKTYTITQAAAVGGLLNVVNNSYINGEGFGSYIYADKDAADGVQVIHVKNDTNVIIQNLKIGIDTTTYASEFDHCIFVENSKNVIISNCIFYYPGGDGVNILNSSNVTVVNCIGFHRENGSGSGHGGTFDYGRNFVAIEGGSYDIIIANNTASGGYMGVDVETVTGSIHDITITGNTFSNFKYGIGVGGHIGTNELYDISITGNTIRNVYDVGIYVFGGGAGSIFSLSDVYRLTITGNTVDSTTFGYGIGVVNSKDVVVSDNYVRKAKKSNIAITDSSTSINIVGNISTLSQDDGIALNAVRNVNVVGNTAYNNTSDGINVIGATSYLINISNNLCYDDAGVQDYGVNVAAGDSIVVSNNVAWGNQDAGYTYGSATAYFSAFNVGAPTGGYGEWRSPNAYVDFSRIAGQLDFRIGSADNTSGASLKLWHTGSLYSQTNTSVLTLDAYSAGRAGIFQSTTGTGIRNDLYFQCQAGKTIAFEDSIGEDMVTIGSGYTFGLTHAALDLGTIQTFVDSDATPDVTGRSYWNTNTTTFTITDFDGTIVDGQIIVVVSKGAITFDVTSSGIKGGTTDIVTAAGDVTTFMYDGTDWLVIARMDMSDDLN